MLLGVLIMLKNEEESIRPTLDSLKGYVNNIVIYDTGSTDQTIPIIEKNCKINNQTLYLKKVDQFHGFPQSRNESIEFAETLDIKYLLMMDAGDELKTNLSSIDFQTMIQNIPSKYRFGVVKQAWSEENNISDHTDIRFIKNKSNCRYNLDYPVHEKFITPNNEEPYYFNDIFTLYQNRDLHGKSTNNRYLSDIETLLKAKPLPRNLFFIGQTYANIKDYVKALEYNKKAFYILKKINIHNYDNIPMDILVIRLLYCLIICNKRIFDVIEIFEEAICYNKNNIYPYILFFDFCINSNNIIYTLPYLNFVSNMKMEGGNINYNFYNYERWRLISTICLLSKTELELGKQSCIKAISAMNKDQDKALLRQYEII